MGRYRSGHGLGVGRRCADAKHAADRRRRDGDRHDARRAGTAGIWSRFRTGARVRAEHLRRSRTARFTREWSPPREPWSLVGLGQQLMRVSPVSVVQVSPPRPPLAVSPPVPSWTLMLSPPREPDMTSVPEVSVSVSLPFWPSRSSLPGPPLMVSLPLSNRCSSQPSRVSPLLVSLPGPPLMMSLPLPPPTASSPSPALMVSLALPASIVSLPGPAWMVSLLLPALMVSLPARPQITSAALVPLRVSLPLVPVMVQPR